MIKLRAYINGEFVNSDRNMEIISPSTNNPIGAISSLTKEEIEFAFTSAKNAYRNWRDISLNERLTYINKFIELIDENKDELAKIMKLEIEKEIPDGIAEINRTTEYIKETIDVWNKVKYTSLSSGNKVANINRVPLGVVLAISPFNYPINLSLAKIIPAMIVGNTVVFKPATNGSLTGGFIAKLIDKANFPIGTFNLVTGRGREIGDTLIENKNISMITFTGGVRVGTNIAKKRNMIPIILELGGNDIGYVRHDADIDLSVNEILKGSFSFSGQRCTAIKRVLLHESIEEEFISKLKEKASKLKLVPVISSSAANYISELIDDSNNRGDELILGGNRTENYFDATIIKTTYDSRAWKEEAFGPLLPLNVIKNEDNLLDIINNTEFGLQNSLFTSDIEWAKEFSMKIESGTVNINRSSSRGPDIFPFLGVKSSGFGTQGIKEALLSMTRILNIVENN